MLSPRGLIANALAGGFCLLVGALYETVYGWAWHESLISRTAPVATIGRPAILGFAISEIVYQQLDRPFVRWGLTIRLPLWMPVRLRGRCGVREITLGTFYAADLGGAVLGSLLDLPGFAQALAVAHGVEKRQLPGRPPLPGATAFQRDIYAARLRGHLAALHALIRLAAATGEPEIHRNYMDQTTAYRAVGVSRIALCAMSGATLTDIAAEHRHAFATHLTSSVGVSAILMLAICVAWRSMTANRHGRRAMLIDELSHDLRSWALRHRQQLAELAGVHGSTAGRRPG